MTARKNEKDPSEFWREYEARIGGTVSAYCLGRYIQGWENFHEPLWGLLIAASDGFRFCHFPRETWLQSIARTRNGGEPQGEKAIFIPKKQLMSIELQMEKSWWKRLLDDSPPLLTVRYLNADGLEAALIAETDLDQNKTVMLSERLQELLVRDCGGCAG
jgi:hypothetical protein